jgi:phospholipid/cholesterol/gamma-HCH transport system substrate-binding protein
VAKAARAKGLRGWLQTSFLERNQRLIGAIGVALILLGTGGALLLSGGVFARTYPVEAHFADAAGIESGNKVTVAGLEAGRVKGVEIRNGEVVMTLAVNRGVELPGDSSADVVIQTLLGKRVVSLVAGEDRQNTLEEVGVIPRDRTSTPIDITDLNDISVRLLDGSDADALNQLLREVTDITQGKRVEITNLVSGLADVTQAVEDRKEELAGLITAFSKISATLGERDDTLVSLVDNLNPVLANLAAHQQDLQRLLVATDQASHETADLVERNRPVLDDTLDSLHRDLEVLSRHQLDLAAGISYLHQSVQGYASVAYSGGNCGRTDPPCERGVPNRWANIFVQSLGPAGVDAFLGECGLVDQLIDEILGTNCEDFGSSAKREQGKTDESTNTGGPLPKVPQAPLPGDLGDLVDSALGGAL